MSYVVEEGIGKGGFGSIYRVHKKDQVAPDTQLVHESRQRAWCRAGSLFLTVMSVCLQRSADIELRRPVAEWQIGLLRKPTSDSCAATVLSFFIHAGASKWLCREGSSSMSCKTGSNVCLSCLGLSHPFLE